MRWYSTSVRLLLGSLIALAIVASTPAPAAACQPDGGSAARPAKTTWSISDAAGQPAVVSTLPVPTNLMVVDQFNSRDVLVSWTNGTDAPGEVLVERQRQIAGTWTEFGQAKVIGNGTTLADSPGPGSYRYRVAASSPVGRSSYTDWATRTVLDIQPGIPQTAFSRNPSRPIGMNLDGFTYYSNDWTFVDAFKANTGWDVRRAGRLWETPPLNGQTIEVDANGYPTHIPQVINGETVAVETSMLVAAWPYPTGNWTCLYDGEGDITFTWDARVVSSSPGRIVVAVGTTSSRDGIRLSLIRSARGNPVRNIRLIAPGFESTHLRYPYHPRFIERLAPFQIIRFLNWNKTNNSPESLWAARTSPTALSQFTDKGIAYEHMIDLTNRIGADPWITVPHLADDNYMRQLARLIRDRMSPERKLYIEFSNEVWNYGFTQRAWADAQPGGYPTSYVRRSLDLFRIFEEEFGGRERLVRVIAGQAVNTFLTEASIRPALQAANGIGKFDAFAIAPYFGHSLPGLTDTSTPEDIITMLEPLVTSAIGDMTRQRAQANLMGARLICYEGGQHLYAGNNATRIAQFSAVNRHPLFYNLLLRYHRAWFEQTGEPFLSYKLSSRYDQYGFWGYYENMLQNLSDAPKMRAFLDAARGTP